MAATDQSKVHLLKANEGYGSARSVSGSDLSDELNSSYPTHPSPPRLTRIVSSRSVQSQNQDQGGDDTLLLDLNEPLSPFVYALTFLSAIGGFLFGYDTGIVSGAMLLLRDYFSLTSLWQEFVISATIGAAAVFAILAGYMNDYVGRKPTILVASFVFTLGAAVLGASYNIAMLLCGRIIVGIGIGLSSMTVPMYIAECAPPQIRGRLVTLNNIFITAGQFIASIVAGIFSADTKNGWRYMLGLAGVPSAIQLVAFLFMPESPRWLLQMGYDRKAEVALQRIRGRQDVDMELSEVRDACEGAALANTQSDSLTFVRMMKTPHVRKALVVGCGLQMFQQICGINTVMYYSATIINMSGVPSGTKAIWMATIPAATNFFFSFLGLYLVERIGRRSLTIGSIAGTMLSLMVLAIGFQLAAVRSPVIAVHNSTVSGPNCDGYSSCNSCMVDNSCGYCYEELGSAPTNGSCASVGLDLDGEPDPTFAKLGRCTRAELKNNTSTVWAYDYCPTDVSWMALVGLVFYLAVFAPGMGPMPWTINSEIYPMWARSTGVAIATTTNWVFNLIISMTFLSLTQAITRYGAFWLYTSFAFLGFMFLYAFLPETKGCTLEQVEQIFKKPWSFRKLEEQQNENT